MRHPRLTSTILVASALTIIGALASWSVLAQAPPSEQPPAGAAPAPSQPPTTPGPYKPVAITLPPAVNDPTFAVFRKQLADVVQKKDRAALARLVAASFYWIPEDMDVADKTKPAIDNLAKAIRLDGQDAFGWDALAGFAAESTGAPDPQRPGVICAPAEPAFDERAADELANTTHTEASDWGYPTRDGIEVRSAPQQTAAVVDKLGLYLVRVLADDSPANAVLATFVKVLTPAGKVGFVPIEALLPLIGEQMCYIKEGNVWKIAGFFGGEAGQ